MRILIIILLGCFMFACSSTNNVRKHSFETKEGKAKQQRYNELQFGGDKQFSYRIKRTEKAYKKAGFKAKKIKPSKKPKLKSN